MCVCSVLLLRGDWTLKYGTCMQGPERRLDHWREYVWLFQSLHVWLRGGLIDTFRENSTLLIDEIMSPINDVGVKFSSTYGVCTFVTVQVPRLISCGSEPRQSSEHYTSGRAEPRAAGGAEHIHSSCATWSGRFGRSGARELLGACACF